MDPSLKTGLNMKKPLAAHISKNYGVHEVLTHLRDVGIRSRQFAFRKFPTKQYLHDAAEICGVMHDAGKLALDFQERIWEKATGEQPDLSGFKREGVQSNDHVKTGSYLLSRCRPLSNIVHAHHGGLDDITSDKLGVSDLSDNFIPAEYAKSVKQWYIENNFLPKFQLKSTYTDLEQRMLLSILADADRLDTEAFFDGLKGKNFNIHDTENNVSRHRRNTCNMQSLLDKLIAHMDKFNGAIGPLNSRRAAIQKSATDKAKGPVGSYSLKALTGFGKTLSSMRFALEHAVHNKLDRVIYCIPFTSILDQMAVIFSEIFGDENILEHHSGKTYKEEEGKSQYHAMKRQENWNSPIVLATNVQFFESYYSNHPSDLRKLHNIAKSVIVLDEVQALPSEFSKPCFAALNSLVAEAGSSVLYTTATMPPLNFFGIEVTEINDEFLTDVSTTQRYTCEIFDENPIETILAEEDKSFLAVYNLKAEVQEAFENLKQKFSGELFCLSGYMYPSHRKQIIKTVKAKLARGEKVGLVSTNLIEAGVDVDFPLVFREYAGLDNLIQTAGRCNREGKIAKGRFIVFNRSVKNFKQGYLQSRKTATNRLKDLSNLIDPSHTAVFYNHLLADDGTDKLDKKGICCLVAKGLFEETSRNFKLIADEANQVIIETERSKELLNMIKMKIANINTYRELYQYSVSLYDKDYNKVKAKLTSIEDYEVLSGCYSSEVGVIVD